MIVKLQNILQNDVKNLVSKQIFARWQTLILNFDFEIEFIKGELNSLPNFLTQEFLQCKDPPPSYCALPLGLSFLHHPRKLKLHMQWFQIFQIFVILFQYKCQIPFKFWVQIFLIFILQKVSFKHLNQHLRIFLFRVNPVLALFQHYLLFLLICQLVNIYKKKTPKS